MTENDVITGDCIETLNRLPAGCADLVFADPPFNIGYQYDVYDDRRAKADYLAWAEQWLAAAMRVLKPTGAFFLAIGDEFAAEHKVRLDALGLDASQLDRLALHLRRELHEEVQPQPRPHLLLRPRSEALHVQPGRGFACPRRGMTTYADRRANPVGKLPDDTWVLRPQETDEHFRADQDTWFVSRVCGTFKERVNHPCQMPEAVLERIIRVASNPGDLVIDPFAGSGTTLAVAKRLGRRFLGCELSEEYAEGVRERLQRVEFLEENAVPAARKHGRHKIKQRIA